MIFTSCNSENATNQNLTTDSTILEKQDGLENSNNIEVAKPEVIEQENNFPNPNTFLGLQLGTSQQTFMENYPEATEGSFWVLMTDISATDMTIYNIEKSTSSGDRVSIDCCFKNDKLVIISVEYKDYQNENDIITGLKSKYGDYSSRKSIGWNDFTNRQNRTTKITKWENSDCCLMELNYCVELGLTELMFADKATQNILNQQNELENKSKIE